MQAVQTSDSWRNFLRGIQSKATVPVYTNSLHYFMRHLGFFVTEKHEATEKEAAYEKTVYLPDKLLEGTDALIEDQVMSFVDYLKGQGRSRALIRTRIAAIKLFYKRNRRKSIDWELIIETLPKTKKLSDRAYTHAELHKALDMAEPREKAAILLMASSGMRVGALPELKIKNLHPIEKYGIYKIVVYEGYDEQYFTFCTPEARQAVEQYMAFRARYEKITSESPLFRRDFDAERSIERETVKPATSIGLAYAINKLMIRAGVRPKITLTVGQKAPLVRHEMKMVHGLRKFFDTQATLAGISPLWVEIMEGHDIKLKESYFRPTEPDLLEGNDRMYGYVSAINALTINEENKLRLELTKVTAQRDAANERGLEIDKVKEILRRMGHQV